MWEKDSLKREKKRGENNAYKQQPRNIFTTYQCACHLHNYNIVKRQRPIQQPNRIEIEIYSTEIYPLDCVNNLLNNWGPLDDETSVKFDLGLSLTRVHCITLFLFERARIKHALPFFECDCPFTIAIALSRCLLSRFLKL